MAVDYSRVKEFRDSVHGYISIPVEFCERFIDTAVFQRLRYVEQTSMRSLYPSAHHDRFSHSLGVYHIGSKAFHHLRKNSDSESKFDWETYKTTFLLACLLHDCAHAPFSHTFEKYYWRTKGPKALDPRILALMEGDETFQTDFKECVPAEHEIASSIMSIEYFGDRIRDSGANIHLLVRMILGCPHQTPTGEQRVENCLISLLNGSVVDVDRLDYIVRDTWASGVDNVDIDLHRLLSALKIVPNGDGVPTVVFKKSAMSVIQSVFVGRNFLYQWIYSHHKVTYDQYLLKTSVEKLSALLGRDAHPVPEPAEQFLESFFDIDRLKEQGHCGSYPIYLPVDGDLLYLIKAKAGEIPEAWELLSREHRLKPLWKTLAEYQHHFKNVDAKKRPNLKRMAKERLERHFKASGLDIELLVEPAKPKIQFPMENSVLIDVDGELLDYQEMTGRVILPDLAEFFYVYLSKPLTLEQKQKAIHAMMPG